MRRLLTTMLLAMALLLPVAARALDASEQLPDPVEEARARELSRQLRCMVCQNESIDDSNADLARDLRHIVRERIVAGDSDAQIRQYLVARYGDFVLLKPPFRVSTLLLWLGPFALLLCGLVLAILVVRRRNIAPPRPLDADEQAELDRLLETRQAERR